MFLLKMLNHFYGSQHSSEWSKLSRRGAVGNTYPNYDGFFQTNFNFNYFDFSSISVKLRMQYSTDKFKFYCKILYI